MRALAWDDEPRHFEALKRHLELHDIELVITDDATVFGEKFVAESWQFVMVDFIQEHSPAYGDDERVGVRLARHVAQSLKGKHMPIFLITKHYDRLSAEDLQLPRTVIMKSKSTPAPWMAGEIYEELVARGVYTNQKRVFLIYGHDRDADGTRGRVEHFLGARGIEAIYISGANLYTEITQGVLEKMNECAGIIAICTPDDEQAGGIFYPRQNVLLEIGMALGLSRGLHRLTILQHWGPAKQNQALLPSDLAGILTIRFEGTIDHQFPILEQRLKELGVAVMPKPGR